MSHILVFFLVYICILLVFQRRPQSTKLNRSDMQNVFHATYENGRSELIRMWRKNYEGLFDLAENRAACFGTRVLKIEEVASGVVIQ